MTRAETKRTRTASKSGAVQEAGDAVRFRAGAELREARERLGWNLAEVAAALRIKLAYLQALEDGRIDALPGNAYTLGFLRTYATTLGLDPDDVARRFRAEAHGVNRPTELAFPAPVPERGVPTGAMVLLGLVVVVAGYIGWYRLSDHEQTATHTVPAVPEQLLAAPHAAPVSPQVASVLPPPGAAPPLAVPATSAATASRPAAPPPAAANTPASAIAGPAPAAAPIAAPASTQPATASAAPAAPATAPPVPASTPAAPAPAETGLVLHATAVTWVQIRAPSGRVTWDHVMQPGESWTVPPDQPDLTLTTGNAGGLEVSDNGVPLGGFGRGGAVRHNIPLTEAGLKAAVIGQPAVGTNAAVATAPSTATPSPAGAPPANGTASAAPPPARHVRHPRPAPVSADDSADDLNARQLDRRPAAPQHP